MRVQDSLTEGLSFFMAELKRLKAVVEGARGGRDAERTVLYLLDEILQGTNTAERQIAARRVVRHLLSSGAIGAVTTHDLTLAQTPELQDSAVQVHFSEMIDARSDRVLHFDYKLKEGVATSTNALKLMELMGLGEVDSAP